MSSSIRGRAGSGADVLYDIANTLSLGFLEGSADASWKITATPFKREVVDDTLQADVNAVFAEVVCQPSPLPELGEGAIWDDRSQRLLFLDILGSRLFRFNPKE